MNIVVIKGRFVANPELKSTGKGTHYVRFTVAVDDGYGEDKKTYFIDCVAWRKTAEFICKYFSKGKEILVNGMLTTNVWQNKEGKKQKSVEVLVDNAEFCGSANKSGPTEVIPSTGPDVFEQTEMVDLGTGNEEELPF